MLNNEQIGDLVYRLLSIEKHKYDLEEAVKVPVVELIETLSISRCYELLFNKSNGYFFNKEEKTALANKVILDEDLMNKISRLSFRSMPNYLFPIFSRAIIEKYPEKIIDFVKVNGSYLESRIDKIGLRKDEKEYLASVIIANKLD